MDRKNVLDIGSSSALCAPMYPYVFQDMRHVGHLWVFRYLGHLEDLSQEQVCSSGIHHYNAILFSRSLEYMLRVERDYASLFDGPFADWGDMESQTI